MLTPLLLSCAVLLGATMVTLTGTLPFDPVAGDTIMLLAALAGVAAVCALDALATRPKLPGSE